MARSQNLMTLVWESNFSIVVIGEHQFFEGYCMVISRNHIREMHNLDLEFSKGVFTDLMRIGKAVEKAYKPLKMNYASFGNIEEHLHWHVIPRYSTELDPKAHPWSEMNQFPKFKTTAEQVELVRERILKYLS